MVVASARAATQAAAVRPLLGEDLWIGAVGDVTQRALADVGLVARRSRGTRSAVPRTATWRPARCCISAPLEPRRELFDDLAERAIETVLVVAYRTTPRTPRCE
jgi:uroporphyrinogen-III synthase